MDKLRIIGGRRLKGVVPVSGAKNAVLPALTASLLTDEVIHLENVPAVRDVGTMMRVLAHLGGETEYAENRACSVQMRRLAEPEAPYELVKTMRASVLTLGPLLARFGAARVSLPGGCAIGERPIDIHLSALEKLGAEVELAHGYVNAKAARLRGCTIDLPHPTVTGTENIMMAATLAEGRTTIRGCAMEPEIGDLADLLRSMGARISGDGTPTISIDGVTSLSGASHEILPDRIEAATFIIAGALAGEEVEIVDCEPAHLKAVLDALESAGVELTASAGSVLVKGSDDLRPVDVTTAPYPGFPTDVQAQFMVAMTQAGGSCRITEAIFENRFMHVSELRRMGAEISHTGRDATVEGPTPLSGAQVMATDLRASACLVLAALISSGTTVIDRVYHIDRGYERIENKLKKLGANIERVRQ